MELDLVSALEAKFETLMTKMRQKTPRGPTLGEIASMKTQKAMLANSTSQVQEANYLNNRGYVFYLTTICLRIIIQGREIMRIYHMEIKKLCHMCLIS